VQHADHHPGDAPRYLAKYDAVVCQHSVAGEEVGRAIEGLLDVADTERTLKLEGDQRIVVSNCCLTHNEARRGSFLNAHAALELCVLATRRSP
jgi:hypothetical protein